MSEGDRRVPFRQRNPLTYQQHRREVFWQITIPVAVGGVVLLALALGAVAAAVQGVGAINRWSHISLIFLIAPNLLIGLFLIVVMAAMIYLLTLLLARMPYFASRLQNIFALLGIRVEKTSRAFAEPFMRLSSFSASLRALLRRVR